MYSKNKSYNLVTALLIILALTFSTNSFALSSGSSDDDSVSDSDSDSFSNSDSDSGGVDSIPLDAGLSILLLGAAALGVKKLHDTKK